MTLRPSGTSASTKTVRFFRGTHRGATLRHRKAQIIEKSFSPHISGQYKSIFFSHLKDVFDTRRRQTCELKLVKKDGLQFYARLESIAISDSAGNNSFCRTVISDITEHKRAENKRKHFASFPKLNPNPVLELDLLEKLHSAMMPHSLEAKETEDQGCIHNSYPYLIEKEIRFL